MVEGGPLSACVKFRTKFDAEHGGPGEKKMIGWTDRVVVGGGGGESG